MSRRLVTRRLAWLWALAFVLLGLGFSTSWLCISELGAMFAVEVIVVLLWYCFDRPLASITVVYFFACGVLLVRESILLIVGRVPCGLLTFGDACAEYACAEYKTVSTGWLFWRKEETTCVRQKCVRSERAETSLIFTTPEQADMRSVCALVFVWMAFLLSVRQVQRWRKSVQEASNVEHVVVILGVPVTYGLCAFHALRTLGVNREAVWEAEGIMNIAELYSAVALLAFQRLLEKQVMAIEQRMSDTSAEASCTVCSQQTRQLRILRGRFRTLVSAGIFQYVFLVFGCNSFLTIAKMLDWFYPARCESSLEWLSRSWFPHFDISMKLNATILQGSLHTRASTIACEDLWNAVSKLVYIANMFTCTIALFAILQFEQSHSHMLKSLRPFLKFWGVKGLLSVNFMQRSVLSCVALVIPSIEYDREAFLNYWLVCVEASLLAVLNAFAYAVVEPAAKAAGGAAEERLADYEEEVALPDVIGRYNSRELIPD